MLDWSIPIKQKKTHTAGLPRLVGPAMVPNIPTLRKHVTPLGNLAPPRTFSCFRFLGRPSMISISCVQGARRMRLAVWILGMNMMIVHEEIAWNSLFSERLSPKSTILFQNRIWSLRMVHPPNLQSVCSCGMLNWAASLTDLQGVTTVTTESIWNPPWFDGHAVLQNIVNSFHCSSPGKRTNPVIKKHFLKDSDTNLRQKPSLLRIALDAAAAAAAINAATWVDTHWAEHSNLPPADMCVEH